MTTKKCFAAIVAFASIMASTSITAQELKQFTLEDLNFGGVNYRKFIPERLYTTWWGDQLMYLDVEETGVVDMKTGKKRALFTLDDINNKLDGENVVRTLQRVSFPYPGKTLALVASKTTRMLYDWSKCEVVWNQPCEGETETHWNKTSRISAYVKDNQLWITDAKGKSTQLTTDGTREILYMASRSTATSLALRRASSGLPTAIGLPSIVWTRQW